MDWEKEGLKKGPFEGDPAFIVFLHFDIFHVFLHLFEGSTKDVSSVVGAPSRCGVFTT